MVDLSIMTSDYQSMVSMLEDKILHLNLTAISIGDSVRNIEKTMAHQTLAHSNSPRLGDDDCDRASHMTMEMTA